MIGRLLVTLIHGYRILISPLLGPRCRFYPSCSQFAIQSLEKYPLYKALMKTAGRIGRCHPWHPGGVDFP